MWLTFLFHRARGKSLLFDAVFLDAPEKTIEYKIRVDKLY